MPLNSIAWFPGGESPNPFTKAYISSLRRLNVSVTEMDSLTSPIAKVEVVVLNWAENLWLSPSPIFSGESGSLESARMQLLSNLDKYRSDGGIVVSFVHNTTPHQWLGSLASWHDRISELLELIDGFVHLTEASRKDFLPGALRSSAVVPHPVESSSHLRLRGQALPESLVGVIAVHACDERRGHLRIVRDLIDAGICVVATCDCRASGGLQHSRPCVRQSGGRKVEVVPEPLSDVALNELLSRPRHALLLSQFDQLNSGLMYLALGLLTPTFAPESEVTKELAARFGAGWIRTYTNAAEISTNMMIPSGFRPKRIDGQSPHNAATILYGYLMDLIGS